MSLKTNLKLKLILPAIAYFAFFALAGSASAATYYIKTGGNNSSACTSNATACATWAGVVAKGPAAGSDVYFKCGNTWTSAAPNDMTWQGTAAASAVIYTFSNNGSNTLVTTTAAHGFSTGDSVTIEGTRDYDGTYTISSASGSQFVIPHAYIAGDGPGYSGLMGFAHKNLNRVVIGAYYMNGGNETVGVMGKKPLFDGNWTTIGNEYIATFNLYDKDYVKFQDLDFYNTRHFAIRFDQQSYYGWADNCSFTKMFNPFGMGHDSYGIILTDSIFTDCNREYFEFNDWGSAFSCTFAQYYIARNNVFHHNWGEAFGNYFGCYHGLVEYNTFYQNNSGTSIYISEGGNVTFRYNLSYCESEPLPGGRGRGCQSGIALSYSEGWENAEDFPRFWYIDIYGNFIANCDTGIDIWGGWPAYDKYGPYPYRFLNIENNTFVGSTRFDIFMEGYFQDVNVRNNIFYNLSGTPRVHFKEAPGYTSTGMNFDYNLWEARPSAPFAGTHDPSYGAPTLAKTSGWTAITGGSLSVTDFKKQSGSRGIDTGVNLGIRDYWRRSLTDIGADDYGSTQQPVCGNGITETGEQCDLGTSGNGACPKTCSANCVTNSCGNLTSIPKTNWIIHSSTQNQTDYPPQQAIDNNLTTFYNSDWDHPQPYPQQIAINLGQVHQNISQLNYSPYQGGSGNGRVNGYRIYISTDGTNWGTSVAEGSFPCSNINQQNINLIPKTGQYLKFEILSAHGYNCSGADYSTAVAELGLMKAAGNDTTAPGVPGGLQVR